MAKKIGGLGKGLDAFFAESNSYNGGTGTTNIKIAEIQPNKDQPRQQFEPEALAALADSIREHGLLSPILIRPLANGGYQIVAGERRWRASRMAGLTEIPAVVREMSEQETMEAALIENLQREDLNPVEEARGYQALMEEFSLTQEQAAKSVGKSRSAVANAVRLLTLPQKVLQMLEENQLSAGHAKALLAVEDEKKLVLLAEETVKKGLSVRQCEKLAKAANTEEKERETAVAFGGDSFYKELSIALENELGRKIKIHQGKEDKGSIEIAYFNKEDLAALADKLAGEKR